MTNNLKDFDVAEIEVSYSKQIELKQKITCAADAYQVFKSIWKYPLEHRECAYALYLDRGHNVLGYFLVSVGGVSGTVMNVKVIIQTALKVNASSIIVAHNRPSGNLNPSEADIKMTEKLKRACESVDLELLDHLIVCNDGYTHIAGN